MFCRDKLEELKLLQKLRKKTGGTAATHLAAGAQDDFLQPRQPVVSANHEDNDIMGGFSKAKTVVTSEEDPNMCVGGMQRWHTMIHLQVPNVGKRHLKTVAVLLCVVQGKVC